MKGLSLKAIQELEKLISKKFDKLGLEFLGMVPKITRSKRIIFKTAKTSLTSLFLQALNSRTPNKLEEEVLKSMLRMADGYIQALKDKTKTNVIQSINSYVMDRNSKVEIVRMTDIKKIMEEGMKKAGNHFKLIANAETNRAVNTGTALQISKVGESLGIKDPTVFFIVVRDERNDKETLRLHLLPNEFNRVWKLSELGNEYHKKGDYNPKVQGTNPNCRCLTDRYAPVITERGTVSLCDVIVGDRVLTHTGKFKKVLGTFSKDGLPLKNEGLYRIEFLDKKGKLRKLRMTADHLMLTDVGWVRADQLTSEHSLKWLIKKCEYCKKDMSLDIEHSDHRFCSIKCCNKSKIGKPILRYNEVLEKNVILSDIHRVAMNDNNEYSFENVQIKKIIYIPASKVSKKARLFDLTVEDDESFVVLGVVSHNCHLTILSPGFTITGLNKVGWKSLDWDEYSYQKTTYGDPPTHEEFYGKPRKTI